jgi:preprotein translocase SecF subunit
VRSHFKREIPFVQHRKVFFTLFAVLLAVAVVGIAARGFNFGIEFLGGTQVTYNDTGALTETQMRDAQVAAGVSDPVVQTTQSGSTAGFMVRTSETDPVAASAIADAVAADLGLAGDSYSIQTIGPNWGGDVTRAMAIAFVVVIALIIVYVSVRYEWKMALMGVLSLVQVLVIVAGVYAWLQIEVTPNVVAALLTIMGYCLYDAVVVFNRVNENVHGLKDGVHRTALQITNWSENQVIVRSVNTTLTSVVPVFVMLLFGGDTLRSFALAMVLGLVLSTCSSLLVAAPAYALWKGREPEWRDAEARWGEKRQAKEAADEASKKESR